MDDFKYSQHAQALDDALVVELTEHRSRQDEEASERAELQSKESGMDFVAGGRSPREVVEEIARSKRERAEEKLREHKVSMKLAEMMLAGQRTVDAFLQDVKG
jgi:hypothetical protein